MPPEQSIMAKLKPILLAGIKCIFYATWVFLIFISPLHFWRVYLAYFLLFLHGLLRSSLIDDVFITIESPYFYTWINGVTWITTCALLLFLWTAVHAGFFFKKENYKMFTLSVVHLILLLIYAGAAAEFGHLILYGALRS